MSFISLLWYKRPKQSQVGTIYTPSCSGFLVHRRGQLKTLIGSPTNVSGMSYNTMELQTFYHKLSKPWQRPWLVIGSNQSLTWPITLQVQLKATTAQLWPIIFKPEFPHTGYWLTTSLLFLCFFLNLCLCLSQSIQGCCNQISQSNINPWWILS